MMQRSIPARLARAATITAVVAAVCACSKEEDRQLLGVTVRVAPAQKPERALQRGDEVPAFAAVAHTGQLVKREDFHGRQFVLCFCSSIRAPDCRLRAGGIRDHWRALRDADAAVLAAFGDDAVWLRAIGYDLKLPYLLVADTDRRLAGAFGLTAPDGAYPKPTAVVANREGEIAEVIAEVGPQPMIERFVGALSALDS